MVVGGVGYYSLDPIEPGARCAVCDRPFKALVEGAWYKGPAPDDRLRMTSTTTTACVEEGDGALRDPKEREADVSCWSCHRPIYWVLTDRGRRMPVDPDGMTHFATCPQGKQWSGRQRRKP